MFVVVAGLLSTTVHVFVAPTLLGGDRLALGDIGVAGIDAQRRLRIGELLHLGDDLLLVARPADTNTTSPTDQKDHHVHRNH